MKTLVLGVAVTLVAAAAFGVSLKDLNVARDPEDLDGAVFATTTSDQNLRAGPGFNFAVIGTVPVGGRVPVIARVSPRNEDGFWFRTQYEGIKWPKKDTLYVELRAPYFCEYKERAAVDSIAIYQPPDAAEPSYAGSLGPGAEDFWHETYIMGYALNVPATVDLAAPFRFVAVGSYSPTDKFTMDFDCNPRR
jgi:hypothetical protein